LLHEKPFSGVNGSGKHNNWSIVTDTGVNLLDPGDTPHNNIRFLLFLCCVLAAVDNHADLLRESAADVGNDHRLGGAEAPPAVISVFLGEQLGDVMDQLVSTGIATHSKKGTKVKTGVRALPDFVKDATDRNRTSPFAFTGNKFEFRMVGSEDSVGEPNVVLNTIMAEALSDAADYIEKADNVDDAVHDYIKLLAEKHQRIIFNGNGYSEEWVEEAERRGLPNIQSMFEAIPALTADANVATFERFKVFTKCELESRADIEYEQYAKKINIEARTMMDMVEKQFIPAAIAYEHKVADTINAVKATGAGITCETQIEILKKIDKHIVEMSAAREELAANLKDLHFDNNHDSAEHFYKKVVPAMNALRKPVDELEMLVAKEDWPMPSYGDLLFDV
jgi:glutamine synthetase